ncbi:MAG TPA: hypothetical protein VN903_27410 [Polyangia bacterium]|jgi:hypothetical protein|nr:hypothetical protein [Polyangia bacterium]
MEFNELAIAIVVPLVVPLMVGLARGSGLSAAKPGELRYSRGLRWLGLSLFALPPLGLLAILVFVSQPLRPEDRAPFVAMLIGFPLLAAPLVLEFFRVRHRFDDARFSFRSPWSKHRDVAWTDVASLKWRKFMKSLDLKSNGGQTFRISPLVAGLPAFGDMALAHIPAAVLTAYPEGRAILQIMSAGAAGKLMFDDATPERLLAAITPRPGAVTRRNG